MRIWQQTTDTADVVGESILWSSRQACLWWIDIPAQRLRRLDPASGEQQIFPLPAIPGFLALGGPDVLLIGLEQEIALFDIPSGRITRSMLLANVGAGRRTNDCVVTRDGDLFFGVMPIGDRSGRAGEFRSLRQPDTVIEDGVYVPNGLAASPDGRQIYFGDTWPKVQSIWTRDWNSGTGQLGPRTPFVTTDGFPGRPDGATVDAAGGYWLAAVTGGELLRFAPGGRCDRRIAIPASHPTKLCFGGPELDTIYVTTVGPRHPSLTVSGEMSGAVIAIDAGISGLPERHVRFQDSDFK